MKPIRSAGDATGPADGPGLSRRALIQAAAAAAATGALSRTENGFGAPSRNRRRPNVVLILADDLGYGELGCYGQKLIRTPRLDRMAREGTRFTDFYAGFAVCGPSRCCLLTGLHTGHARVRENSVVTVPPRGQDGLEPEDVTIAQVMKAAGYSTGLFGKWGFGPDSRAPKQPPGDHAAHPSWPRQKGFDEFVGFVDHGQAALGYYATYMWNGNKRFELPENANNGRGTYTPDLIHTRALDFMRRHRKRPFFMMLAPTLPHTPNISPTTEPYSDRPWSESSKKHAAMVTHLDGQVGRVLDTLRKLRLDKDTIVLFASDNGPADEAEFVGGDSDQPTPAPGSARDNELFETTGPLRGVKNTLYEGGIRVPMIAWGPSRVRRGVINRSPWAAWDLMPTLAGYARVTTPRDIDGRSASTHMTGGRRRAQQVMYWERKDAEIPRPQQVDADRGREVGYVQALRKGRWKAVRYSFQTKPYGPLDALAQTELYDLATDVGEARDVAARNPKLVAQLTALMRTAHVEAPYARAPYKPRRLSQPKRSRTRRARP